MLTDGDGWFLEGKNVPARLRTGTFFLTDGARYGTVVAGIHAGDDTGGRIYTTPVVPVLVLPSQQR